MLDHINLEPWLVERAGQKFIRFGGLLHTAHQMGQVQILTEWLNPGNEAYENSVYFFKAHVVISTPEGKKLESTGYGDACKANVGKMIHQHLFRMAETRAIVRALRFATGISITALEELGGGDAHTTTGDDL